MTKANFFASLLVISATLSSAHAAQVVDASCADTNNGTFGETALHQVVICANSKWQDATTVPVAIVEITKYNFAKKFKASYAATSFVGTRSIGQHSDGQSQFTLGTTVVAFNADKTAHVVIDFEEAGWQKRVDAIVPMNATTTIATDNNGAEYRLTVKRTPT